MTMTPAQEAHLARLADMERNMLAFAQDWKYIPTLPRGKDGDRAILMLDYLIPDLAHIVATHYVGTRGWRQHPELATVKPRRVLGGILEDLVAYVPVDEPDEPIVVEPVPYDPDAEKTDLDDKLPWRVVPKVNEIFEKRPDDD